MSISLFGKTLARCEPAVAAPHIAEPRCNLLPGELQAFGYDATEIGEGERILPAAITQQFTLRLVWKLSRAVTFC